jgi:hypothetical protein
MSIKIHASRAEHKAATELERIRTSTVLPVTATPSSFPGLSIFAPEKMKHVGGSKADGTIGLPVFVDQQRKCDGGVLAKDARVIAVTQTYRCQVGSVPVKFRLIFAQLRDVLAAENSSVVTKKDNHRRPLLPQRAQTDLVAIRVR